MYRIITIEREFGCGAACIAAELSGRLDWKLWDRELTEEIAREAQVDRSVVERCEERCDTTFQRLARVFWRGSFEGAAPAGGIETFDTDRMVAIMQKVLQRAAAAGNSVFVGRGAPYLLRERSDAFHVFLYAPRAEKLRRLLGSGKDQREAEMMLESVDRDRIAFVKRYFGADWPTRSLYHMMINTAIGDENVISLVLNTMRTLEKGRVKIA